MNQDIIKDSFCKVMEANNLHFEEIGDRLIIKKSKNKNKSIQTYILLSILGVGIGIYLSFTLGRAGKVLIGLSLSILIAAITLREREKESEKKSIEIGSQSIDIRERFKIRKVNLEDIAEFKTNVEKHKNLFAGTISILTENRMKYEFLEIFGTNEQLVQEDLIIISNYIIDNYLSNEDELELNSKIKLLTPLLYLMYMLFTTTKETTSDLKADHKYPLNFLCIDEYIVWAKCHSTRAGLQLGTVKNGYKLSANKPGK